MLASKEPSDLSSYQSDSLSHQKPRFLFKYVTTSLSFIDTYIKSKNFNGNGSIINELRSKTWLHFLRKPYENLSGYESN